MIAAGLLAELSSPIRPDGMSMLTVVAGLALILLMRPA